MSRAQSAANDDGVGVDQRAAQGRLDSPEVVADFDLQQRVDAVGSQLLSHPRTVGVDDLAEQQLGADGDDVTPHERAPWHDARATCTGHR